MCFAIPYQVKQIKGKSVLLEDGRTIRLLPHLTVHVGDYLQLRGDIMVSVLTEEEGLSIRTLLASLSEAS